MLRIASGEIIHDLKQISMEAGRYFWQVLAAPAHFEGRFERLRAELRTSQVEEIGHDRWVTLAKVQVARPQRAARKASGRGGAVAEMTVGPR